MSLAFYWVASALPPAPQGIPPPACQFRRTRHLHHLTRWRDMKLPEPFGDWTVVEYVVAGVALLVCLANLLR